MKKVTVSLIIMSVLCFYGCSDDLKGQYENSKHLTNRLISANKKLKSDKAALLKEIQTLKDQISNLEQKNKKLEKEIGKRNKGIKSMFD